MFYQFRYNHSLKLLRVLGGAQSLAKSDFNWLKFWEGNRDCFKVGEIKGYWNETEGRGAPTMIFALV